MPDRTNATAGARPRTSTDAGILRPEQLAELTTLTRTPCHPDLDHWVENHWTLTWDLPGVQTFDSQTLPHPACHLGVELGHPRSGVGDDRVVITGVATRRFDVRLAESGWVHTVKFRPGGLAALIGEDAAQFTDRTTPAAAHLPTSVTSVLRDVQSDGDLGAVTARIDDALRELVPADSDPDYDLVLRLIDDMLGDRDLLSVAQVEERHAVGKRRLQRLFARYVGASPKWVLARYRMHDVVSELDAGYDGSLADLAVRFGWYDQAHFTRDFARLVGVPPHEYRSR